VAGVRSRTPEPSTRVGVADDATHATRPIPRVVEAVFESDLPLMALRVGRVEIRTTIEHPFWVEGRGWTPANLIIEGDRLRSHDGSTVVVTGLAYSLGMGKVYNRGIAK
jgi:hypothetical protein